MDPCSLCLAPRWRILTKLTQCDTVDTIHPLAPILGVNGSTGAGFQQAPYKYKLTTLTDISPCSLTPFQALDLPDIVQQINALLKSNQLSPKINVKPSSHRQAKTFASLYLSQTIIASFHQPGFLPFPLMSWPSADITCARCPTCGLWLVTSSNTEHWLVKSDSLSVMRRQWWHSVSVTVS